MPAQEIQEYETLLKIVPHDKEVLFRLGILYFQQGHNARALRIYELLKKAKDTKAEELIAFYDAYLPQGYFFESAE
jgi:lipopolysaccharide biosynthesis regulator YciM